MLWEHHTCIPCMYTTYVYHVCIPHMSVMPTTSPALKLLFPSCSPPLNVTAYIFFITHWVPLMLPTCTRLWAITRAWWPSRQHPWRKRAQWWSAQPPKLWRPWLPALALQWDPTDEQFARGQCCCYESCFCRFSSASWHGNMWCMCVQRCTHKYV